MKQWQIKFRSSFMGEHNYDVWNVKTSEEIQISYKTSRSDYELSISTQSKEIVLKDLYKVREHFTPARVEIVKAFREYLIDQWNEYLDWLYHGRGFELGITSFDGPAEPIILN